MPDPDLARFRAAQDADGTYDRALGELRRGRKTSHWMWFVFPQIAGLGLSATSRRYALTGLDEARAYLADAVLGPRLRACAQALLDVDGGSAEAILGPIDAVKLRSSMTLFSRADSDSRLWDAVLARFFAGEPDPQTLALIG